MPLTRCKAIDVIFPHLRWSYYGKVSGVRHGYLSHCWFSQSTDVRVCANHEQTNWHASAIVHYYHRRAIADHCGASAIAPMVVGTTLSSTNACDQYTPPVASSWSSRVRYLRSHMPVRDHACKRHQQVWAEPYSFSRSTQAQLVVRTSTIPVKVRWSSVQVRQPRYWHCGRCGAITFQLLRTVIAAQCVHSSSHCQPVW